MKQYGNEAPKPKEVSLNKIRINFGVYEVSEDELYNLWRDVTKGLEDIPDKPSGTFKDDHKYAYYQVQLPIGQWTRDGIVNAIIRDKYRQDEMEAITNNMAAITAVFLQTLVSDGIVAATKYLKESINDDNTKRFKEMQEWRAMAKKVASEIIKE